MHESKVEKFKIFLEKYNVDARDCVYITDTLGDIHEARKAGLESIAVSWGFNNYEDTFKKGNPVRLVHSPQELLKQINVYFGD